MSSTSAQQAHAGIVRTTVYWSRIAQTRPANGANPFDPAYRFDDLDEFVRNAGPARHGGHADDLGHAVMGERRQGPELRADQLLDDSRTSRGARVALLGPLPGLPLRALLLGLERVEPRPVPLAAVRLEGQAGRTGDLREALPRSLRGDQGGQLPLAGRHRRDLGPRARPLPGQAGHAGDRVTGQVRGAALEAEAGCCSSTPGRTTRIRPRSTGKPLANVALAERDSRRSMPRFENPSRPLVQAEERDRSGSPSTGTRRSRRSRRASPTHSRPRTCGQAITFAANDPNVTIFIWFILRDDPTSAWQSGLVQRDGAKKPAFSAFHEPGDAVRRAEPADLRQGRHHEPDRQVRGARALVALRRRREGRHDDRRSTTRARCSRRPSRSR